MALRGSPLACRRRLNTVTLPTSSQLTQWERIGETTRWGRYLADIERRIILRAEQCAGRPGHGIDLGCGGGRWSKLLADRGWRMTCVDVNPQDLCACQFKVPEAKCILVDAYDRMIPAPAGSAAIALCVEVAPVIESDWFPEEASRVLASGGILVGVFITGRSLRGILSRAKDFLFNRRTEYRFYQNSYADSRRRLLAFGFEILHEESFCWGPCGRDSNSPLVPLWRNLERAFQMTRLTRWGPWIAFIAQKKT